MKYRAEIDGLRALAVVPVIAFHAGLDAFSGGYVGVDVFFVISGYLITSILIVELQRERLGLAHFYERRARRILPALVVVTSSTVPAAWLLMSPADLTQFGNALLGVATFSSNIVFWSTQGYFSESSELNPLIHTWSLAVEEQFYLLFPLLLLCAWRLGRRRVLWLVVVLACLSLVMSEWAWRNAPTANFYLAPTRVWELLAGSIAALIVVKHEVQHNEGLAAVGLAAVVFAIFAFDKNTPFPSVYALLPVAGVFLIVVFAGSRTVVAKVLGCRPLVGIGLISYSMYLWHQPLFAFYRICVKSVELPPVPSVVLIALSLLLAFFSWKYVEEPFRKKSFLGAKRILVLSLAALLLLAGVGLVSKQVANGYEFLLAQKLSTSNYVYYSNLDDRKFIEGRLVHPLDRVDTLVMGSSRLMQVGSSSVGSRVLNVSLSGASVEDYVAFVGESIVRTRPASVILGADPWLFNRFDEQDRWKSSTELYAYWLEQVSSGDLESDKKLEPFLEDNVAASSGLIQRLYGFVNSGDSLVAEDASVEALGKKAYDGRHIYNEQVLALTDQQIRRNFLSLMGYSMSRYEHDVEAMKTYVRLIEWLQARGVTVWLVLTPYHPELYARMINEKPVFASIEKEYRELARSLGVTVVGSYDPEKAGCKAIEFYDGMHPKDVCMRKVLGSLR